MMMKQSDRYSKDIRSASLLAIIYGVCGLVFVPIAPFLTPSAKTILMPNMPNLDVFDIAWNLTSNALSLCWGWRVRNHPETRLKNLANLTGLYSVKTCLVVGTAFIGLWQPIRFVYLLPALFFLIIGLRAQINAQKYQTANPSVGYKKSLGIWAIASVALILIYAFTAPLKGISENKLMIALDAKDSGAVIAAVHDGEDPNQKIMGRPLMFIGIEEGDSSYLKALIDAGADINSTSSWGRTALHEAALHGQVEIAEYLLQNGANVNAKNNRGETPLFYAEGGIVAGPRPTERHKEVARLLRQHGAIEGSQIKIEDILDTISRELSQKTPLQVDANTRLDSVVTHQNVLMYKYTLLNVSLENIAQSEIGEIKESVNSEMTSRLKRTICQGDSMKPLRERGVDFRYIYFDASGNEITNISISSSECQ